ncbi:MAG: hypothetical protein IK066_00650 [Kiritimatiellae bacterium]|nr:hypothetical protein [Kiritimatiellia bacterium]
MAEEEAKPRRTRKTDGNGTADGAPAAPRKRGRPRKVRPEEEEQEQTGGAGVTVRLPASVRAGKAANGAVFRPGGAEGGGRSEESGVRSEE